MRGRYEKREAVVVHYGKLEYLIIPVFYNRRGGWISIVKDSFAKVNGRRILGLGV